MRAPYRNGDANNTTPSHRIHHHPSPSGGGGVAGGGGGGTLAHHKLKRFNTVGLVLRLAAFSFSFASSIFMLTNRSSNSSSFNSPSLRWFDFDAFRYVVAANAIVAIYSIFEMGASVWEISKDATLFPEVFQVWFDFGHDQVFAYMLLSGNSAGTQLARTLKGGGSCVGNSAFCIQSDISIALGFAGFLFLALSSLHSGFRVVRFLISGSRFLP